MAVKKQQVHRVVAAGSSCRLTIQSAYAGVTPDLQAHSDHGCIFFICISLYSAVLTCRASIRLGFAGATTQEAGMESKGTVQTQSKPVVSPKVLMNQGAAFLMLYCSHTKDLQAREAQAGAFQLAPAAM